MGEKEVPKERKMIPQIQKMVDSYKNTFIEHIDYTQYIDMFRKVLDSNKSGEAANNSQEHTTLAMLMMLERAKKQVYVYTDALSKNFLDDKVLKALIWAGYHNVDVHMMFRGKLPEQSLLSPQKRYLWDTVKLTAKTFKSVTGNDMKEGLKEIFLVDNNIRYEFIRQEGSKPLSILPPNELSPANEGLIYFNCQEADKVIESLNNLSQPSKVGAAQIKIPCGNVKTR